MLHFNKKFIEDYRNKEAHIVSGHTFDLMLKKKHQGNQETYLAILDMLEQILSCFNYISLSCWVRLPFLESLSDEGLQIYEFDNNIPFEKWRLNVLSKYADLCWMKDEYQDYLDFNFDYKVNEEEMLLSYGGYSGCSGQIEVWYDQTKDYTYSRFSIALREEFFLYQPWGDGYENFTLSKEEINFNIIQLEKSICSLKKLGYSHDEIPELGKIMLEKIGLII